MASNYDPNNNYFIQSCFSNFKTVEQDSKDKFWINDSEDELNFNTKYICYRRVNGNFNIFRIEHLFDLSTITIFKFDDFIDFDLLKAQLHPFPKFSNYIGGFDRNNILRIFFINPEYASAPMVFKEKKFFVKKNLTLFVWNPLKLNILTLEKYFENNVLKSRLEIIDPLLGDTKCTSKAIYYDIIRVEWLLNKKILCYTSNNKVLILKNDLSLKSLVIVDIENLLQINLIDKRRYLCFYQDSTGHIECNFYRIKVNKLIKKIDLFFVLL